MFFDFGVAGNRLRNFRDGIMIPVVLSAMTNKYATVGFELSDQIFSLH